MDVGDVDGDGHVEVAVSLAGSFAHGVPAGAHVLQANAAGTALDAGDDYTAGGVEHSANSAGRSWIAIADFGELGASRHASEAAAGEHVSTEVASFDRHVDCADCHNVHASTDASAEAPVAYGQIVGTWGVRVDHGAGGSIDYAQKRGVASEYELCFKCHSGWNRGETRNIAAEVDTAQTSVHAIEASATGSTVPAETFEGAWTNDSILYCTSCHGNSDVGGGRAFTPRGSRRS